MTIDRKTIAMIMASNICDLYKMGVPIEIFEKNVNILLRFFIDNFHPYDGIEEGNIELYPLECVRDLLIKHSVKLRIKDIKLWSEFTTKFAKYALKG